MRLSGWKLPLERLSATSLTKAIQCPEKFRQQYVCNKEESYSGDAFLGNVFHEAVTFFEPDKDVDGLLMETWAHTLQKRGEPRWREDQDVEKMYVTAKNMLKAYWPVAEGLQTLATEIRFEEIIAGVPIVGYIDRELPDRIVETKTTKQKQSKPKMMHNFQGQLYSLVSEKPVEWQYVTKQVEPKVYTGVLANGAELAPDLLMPRQNPDRTVKVISFAVERLNDYYSRYGPDQPWPVDGIFHDWLCSYCGYKKECPAWQ